MYPCPICGGQNALHFSTCPHAKQGPRVSALRTSLPPATNPSALPYMHGTGRVTKSEPQTQNLPGTLAHALEMYDAKWGKP